MATTDILQTNDSTEGDSIATTVINAPSNTTSITDTSITNNNSTLSPSPNNKPSTGRRRRGTVSQQQQPTVLSEKPKIEKSVIEEEPAENISSPIPQPLENDEVNNSSDHNTQSQDEQIQMILIGNFGPKSYQIMIK
ncbi:unnamed protein product [Cunninghamella blakesleeana]